jgi:N-acyl-D-amino-acid deacylase
VRLVRRGRTGRDCRHAVRADHNARVGQNAPHPEYIGRTIAEIAATEGRDPRDVVLDLLSDTESWISAVHFALSEDDVRRVLSDPRVMVGSDGVATVPSGPSSADQPHPRTYGTFARVLSHYVRETGLLTWPEAIRRMTSLPAQRLGWTDRGRLAPGGIADIVILDPATVADTATFTAPHSLAVGIDTVLVAGTIAFTEGHATTARAGRVMRRS